MPSYARLLVPCLLLALPVSAAETIELDGIDLKTRKPPKDDGAEGDLGLDLSGRKPRQKKPPRPPPEIIRDDLLAGPAVLAIPPCLANGKPDTETYKPLHAVLGERLGARLIPEEATLKAIEQEKLEGPALVSPEGLSKLATALKAEQLVVFSSAKAKLEGRILGKPGAPPSAQASFAWTRKVGLSRAREIFAHLLKTGRVGLLPAAVVAVAPTLPDPAKPPEMEAFVIDSVVPEPEIPDDDIGDAPPKPRTPKVEAPRPSVPLKPLNPPPAVVLVGAGASFRDFQAVSVLPIVPTSPKRMTGLAANVAIYPLRMVRSLAGGKLADFALEGFYRRNLATATMLGPGYDGAGCEVQDDEIVARASYRYPLGGRLPRIGAGVAWTSERTLFSCAAPALSTRYRSTELHLKLMQPIWGERLALELSGGPRFVFSVHASGFANQAFSAEGWLIARPTSLVYLRAGSRVTRTRLTSWPEGIAMNDTRTFLGLELGAAL